jgi:hypothetical protein
MIISQLNGGLGNQMFQYALGRKLSLLYGVPLKLDFSMATGDTTRTYRLGNYCIPAEFATDSEISGIKSTSLFDYLKMYYLRSIYKEPHFQYDKNILHGKKNVYLQGYWQSEKYFKDIEDTLVRDFTLLKEPDYHNREVAEQIREQESVSIHIRRGDYVTSPTTNAYHGICSEEYYVNAIRTIESKVKNPHIYLFSDDTDWVRQQFYTGHPTTIMDFNGTKKDYADMWLMSLCRHHIIANSSFSWWGAWLCRNPGKIVIAPQRWFANPDINTSDLIPNTWIQA